MRHISFAVAVLLAFITSAKAADIPRQFETEDTGGFQYKWSGMYLGANAGYGAFSATDNIGSPTDNFEGFVGGVHLGVNYQYNYLVFGAEADIGFSTAEEDQAAPFADIDVEALGSLRARIGIAFDRVHVYGTGGIGFGSVSLESNINNLSDDGVLIGYVLGAGAEFMITENLIAGIEYLHYEFGEEDFALNLAFSADGDADIIRGRLSWKFNLFNY